MSNNNNASSMRSQSLKRKFSNSNCKLTSRKMNATTSYAPSDQPPQQYSQQMPYQHYDQMYQSQNPQSQQHQQFYETHQPYHQQQYGPLPTIPPPSTQMGDLQRQPSDRQQQFHHTTIYNIQNCYVQQPQHEMHQIFFPTDQYRHQSSQQYESSGYKSAPPQNQFAQPPQPACWNPQPPVYNDRSSSMGLNQHGPPMPQYHPNDRDGMFTHPQLPGHWNHQNPHMHSNSYNNHHDHSVEEFTNNPFKFKHHDQLAPNFQQLTQVNKQLGESIFNPTHMLTRGYNCDQIVTRQLSHIPNKVQPLKKRLLKRKIIRSKSQGSKLLPVVQDPHNNNKLKIKRRRILGKRCRSGARERCSKCRNCHCFDHEREENHDQKQSEPVNFGTSAAMTLRKRKQKIVTMPFQITKEKETQKQKAINKVLNYPGINTIQEPAPGCSFELQELEQRIVEEHKQIQEKDVKLEGELQFRRIGKLTLDERYHKIKRYQAKRDRRQWEKKISYDCRKQVADKRLRIKGRFIRKEDQNELMKQILGSDQVAPGDMNKFNDSIKVIMKTMKQEPQKQTPTTNSQPKRKQAPK